MIEAVQERDQSEAPMGHNKMNKRKSKSTATAKPSPRFAGSVLDFQTAPYEALCGCVSAPIPSGMGYLWDNGPNLDATRRLLEGAKGNRVVCVNCARCKGTGIAPNKGSSGDTTASGGASR